MILCEDQVQRSEAPPNLPEVGSLVGSKAVRCPLLQSHSPVSLLLSVFNLLYTVCRLHKGIQQKVTYICSIVIERKNGKTAKHESKVA